MQLLYKNRTSEDQEFIKLVCDDILDTPQHEIEDSNDFAFVYVEGRNREINTLEDFAAFKSTKLFSKYNYPIYCFVNNPENFIADFDYDGHIFNYYRFNIIQIPELNSLEEYSKFCINELYFKLPETAENIITIQPDGMLLKSGWEDWIIKNDFSLIGAHWQHITSLEVRITNNYHIDTWYPLSYNPVYGCNLGFSFRKASKMREIKNHICPLYKEIRQRGDTNCPEDAFFSYLGFGSKICKYPTIKECEEFSIDPLTPKIYNSNNKPFGFHYFSSK